MKLVFAFLDVLGFSSYSERDLAGAQLLLRHQEFILRQKLNDGHSHPAASYGDPSSASLAEAHLVDSFKHFLPFSDSVFIASDSPDKFAKQLSHFLIECLQLVGHAYDDAADPARPEAVDVTVFPAGTKHSEHWYPPLWRGGLAFGEIDVFDVTGLRDRQVYTTPNAAGPAVVKAVGVERFGGRGPRLFCEREFIQNFGADIQRYFWPVTDSISELLWPAFLYSLENPAHIELSQFHELWGPAVGLWKSKQGHKAFEHYDEFLKLLVRSFLCWARIRGCEQKARDKARACIANDLSESLIETYFR